MKPKFYFCDLWRMNFYFFLGWKWKDFSAYTKKHFDHEPNNEIVPAGKMIQVNKDDGGCIMCIWTAKKNDMPTLAHEALHAANWTLRRAGWDPDLHNDEPQAYLMMNIIRQAMKK